MAINVKKIIAVDFDGTITTNTPYPITGEIRIEAINILKKLQKAGYILCLWTCRENKDLEEAVNLLKKYNLTFDYININPKDMKKAKKINADFYIDNKNIFFDLDWYKIEKELLGENKNVLY